MNDAKRLDMAAVLARKESDKRYKYGQANFNFQLKIFSITVRDNNDLFHKRHDWRRR